MKKNDVFPSKYTKAADLDGREPTVVIASITMEEIGEEKDRKPVAYFQGDTKPIVLNATNWDKLEFAFGDSDDWPGKKVVLYTEIVHFQGRPTLGIRMRPVVPKKPLKEDLGDEIPPEF
jgi:hypothetical protein